MLNTNADRVLNLLFEKSWLCLWTRRWGVCGMEFT
uniref:Uncharacterized protein n=1 Tax=Peronospora matthiolae TaxID=2874970 RepID=A0AAV1T5E6_9STRA